MRRLAVVMLGVLLVSGCSGEAEPEAANLFGPQISSQSTETDESGEGVAHTVITHCGVQATRFQGQLWLASPPITELDLEDWGFNDTQGRFIVHSPDSATFIADSGLHASFTLAAPGTPDPNRSCF